MFSFQSWCFSTLPISGSPLQKYTHFTTAQMPASFFKRNDKETFARAFFIVFMLLWKVCAGVRETDLQEDGGCLYVCSCAAVWGGCTSRLRSQGFCGKHARFCASHLVSFHHQPTSGVTADKVRLTNGRCYKTFNSFFKNNTFKHFLSLVSLDEYLEFHKNMKTCILGYNQLALW